MLHGKHLRMKMRLFAAGLIAATSLSYAQSVNPSATHVSACEVPTPKKTISEWSEFSRYQEDNAMLEPRASGQKRVVFVGSSSIDNWGRRFDSTFFSGKPYINRGISGETTPQMVLRFQRDVVALKPVAVVFLGGTNEIAGNTGPMTLDMTQDNIHTMASIAEANGIKMILASQLPVTLFPGESVCMPQQTCLLSPHGKRTSPQSITSDLLISTLLLPVPTDVSVPVSAPTGHTRINKRMRLWRPL